MKKVDERWKKIDGREGVKHLGGRHSAQKRNVRIITSQKFIDKVKRVYGPHYEVLLARAKEYFNLNGKDEVELIKEINQRCSGCSYCNSQCPGAFCSWWMFKRQKQIRIL